jgi:hypothetical protein
MPTDGRTEYIAHTLPKYLRAVGSFHVYLFLKVRVALHTPEFIRSFIVSRARARAHTHTRTHAHTHICICISTCE